MHVYPLSGLLYCGYCNTKMRAQNMNGYRYYRDRARELGYDCNQPGLVADEIELQVVNLVREMKPPSDWKQRAVEAIGQLLGDRKIKERTAQIEAMILRMDFRWDNGFILDKDEYLEKRLGLQQKLEELKPIPMDELEMAADMLTHFDTYWKKAENEPEEQHRLMHLIFERIWVKENAVVTVCLRPNYHVTVYRTGNLPTDVPHIFYQSGSDGHPPLITIWKVLVACPENASNVAVIR